MTTCAQLSQGYDSFDGIGGYSQSGPSQGYQNQGYQNQGYDSWGGGDRYSQGYDQGYGCGPDCGCNECGEERRILQTIRERRDMRSGRLCDRLGGRAGNRQSFRDQDFSGSYFDHGDDYDASCYDTGGDCQRGPFYISGFGGVASIENFLRRTDVDDGDINTQTIDRIGADIIDGGAVGLSIGRYIHPRGRSEFEFTYRNAGVDEVFENRTARDLLNGGDAVVLSQNFQDASGDINAITGIFNVVFDFKRRQVGCAHLYAGGGIGAFHVDGTFSTTGATPTDFDVDSSGLAYQGILGVAYPTRSGMDLFSEYRYTGSQNIAVDDVTNDVPLGAFRLDSHNLYLGIRIYR